MKKFPEISFKKIGLSLSLGLGFLSLFLDIQGTLGGGLKAEAIVIPTATGINLVKDQCILDGEIIYIGNDHQYTSNPCGEEPVYKIAPEECKKNGVNPEIDPKILGELGEIIRKLNELSQTGKLDNKAKLDIETSLLELNQKIASKHMKNSDKIAIAKEKGKLSELLDRIDKYTEVKCIILNEHSLTHFQEKIEEVRKLVKSLKNGQIVAFNEKFIFIITDKLASNNPYNQSDISSK